MKTMLIILFAVSVVFGQTKIGYSGFALPMDRDFKSMVICDSLSHTWNPKYPFKNNTMRDNSTYVIGYYPGDMTIKQLDQPEVEEYKARQDKYLRDRPLLDLIYFYDIYKTECYNDSTIDTLSYKTTWIIGEITQDSLIHCSRKVRTPILGIRHKQSTFDGFMEFLRGKTK